MCAGRGRGGGSLQVGVPCLSLLGQPVRLCPGLLMLYQEESREAVHQQGEPHGLGLGCCPDAAGQSRVLGTRTGLFLAALTGTSLFPGPFPEAGTLGPAGAHVGHLGPLADGQNVLAQWYKTGYSLLTCKIELL